MAALRFNTSPTTGNLNTVSNTSVTGSAVFTGTRGRRIEDLSVYVQFTGATASLTIAPHWQVSNTDTDADYVTLPNGAEGTASAVIATGAVNVTQPVQAPPGVTGYKYARALLLVGGATGASGDLFSIAYSFRQLK